MAATVVAARRMRPDDVFFPAMALLILTIVLTGFGKTYFFAGMVMAKLPSRLVHIHGAIFISWIFLLVLQTCLVSTHNVKLHMKLGPLAVLLMPAMVVFGILELFDFMHRALPEDGPEAILVGDLETLAIFVALTTWGLIARRDPPTHKRLMILGTMAIMGPAIARWNVGIAATLGIILALPLLILAYDVWALKRVHRTTQIAIALTAAWVFTVIPFSNLPFWHQCVEWMRHN